MTPNFVNCENITHVLEDLTRLGASDIKLVNAQPPLIYCGGEWRAQEQYAALTSQDIEQLHRKLCKDVRHLTIPESGPWDVDYRTQTYANNFRVNGGREQGRVFLILRPLPRDIPTFDKLNLLDEVLGAPPTGVGHLTAGFEYVLRQKRGLILVTGPTGSGKSTTLASMVDYLNTHQHLNIITVEDPIEFTFRPKHSHVLQREVGSDTSSFATALRASLRQKPDVILVGEMRDKETIDAAFRAAATGHLVLSTLHNNEAAQTIERIINEFEPGEQHRVRHQLSEVLVGIFAQQLVPTTEGKRQVVHEAMVITPQLRAILRPSEREKGSYLQALRDELDKQNPLGSRSFDRELQRAADAGLITEATGQEFAIKPDQWHSRQLVTR